MISQIGYHYKPNLIVGPEGGCRAPNAETDSGKLYEFVRENRGFILINNQEKLNIPNTFTLTHDGTVYNSEEINVCLLYTSPSPRDRTRSRMPSSA